MRKSGPMALESLKIEDPFLAQGVRYLVDGYDKDGFPILDEDAELDPQNDIAIEEQQQTPKHLFAGNLTSSNYQSVQLDEHLESTTETVYARDGESTRHILSQPTCGQNHHVEQLPHPKVLAALAVAIERYGSIEISAWLRKGAVRPIPLQVPDSHRTLYTWISLVLKQGSAAMAGEKTI